MSQVEDRVIEAYIGPAGTGKTQAAYEWIKKTLEAHPGETLILLVPDAATYKAERDLATYMGGGFSSVRVVGFSRLAYQIYQSLGARAVRAEGLSKVGRNLLLRLAMKRSQQEAHLLNQALKQAQFSDVLGSFMTECKSFKVGPENLWASADKVQDPNLGGKLKELASLMEAYDGLVKEANLDDREGLEVLIEALKDSPLLTKAHVVIDGFHWFTPLQYELIYNLVKQAQRTLITITLPSDAKEIAYQSTLGALFSRPYEVYKTLKGTYGQTLKVTFFKNFHRYSGDYSTKRDTLGPISPLEDLMAGFFGRPQVVSAWGADDKKDKSPRNLEKERGRIPIIAAYNKEREADEVVRRILALVEEKGARYRDCMIVLRDSETYGDILEKAFQTYEVPYFIDQQKSMRTHPLADMMTALLEVVRYNYNNDAIFRLLKTDLVPVGPDLDLEEARFRVDQLENYCLEFGVHHYKWDMPSWPWMVKGPDGKAYSDLEEDRHKQVNETHRAIMDWLEDWFDFASKVDGHTGREWAQEIYGVLDRLGVAETLYRWAQEADEAGQPVEKASHEQMYSQVMNFLDQLARVGGDRFLSLDELALLLEEGLEDMNYSMVPPSLDHVLVTTVERGYTQERKHVFVMGLNDGLFPRKMGDEGLIKDRERAALAEVGLNLAGGALAQAFNENFLFYLACSRAQESLTLSYANLSGEGEAAEPALVIKRLIDLGYAADPYVVGLTLPMSQDGEGDSYEGRPEFSYMWNPRQALSLLSSRWGELADGQTLSSPWWALFDWAMGNPTYRLRLMEISRGLFDTNEVAPIHKDVVEGLFLFNNYMTGSVTRLEKYQACPFKFYAEYGLKLKARKVASYGAPEIGTLLHDHLKTLGDQLLKEGKDWRDLSPEELHKRCQAVAKEGMDQSLLGYSDIGEDDRLDGQEGALESPHDASDAAYNKARYDRLVKTLEATVRRLVDWSSKSEFSMDALEKSFGMPGGWPSVDIDLGLGKKGAKIKLQGQIDRIDTWKNGDATYGLIVDYKTGKATISGGELYYGLKLQLLTYWMAYTRVKGNEGIIPAGTIYTPVKNAKLSVSRPLSKDQAIKEFESADVYRNFGYFSNSPDVLMNMDDLEINNKAGHYVPVRLTKNGINGQDRWKTKSLGDYQVMASYVAHKMGEIGQGIGRGDFAIRPYMYKKANACSYCDYKTVCRFESSRNRYNYLDSLTEDQALDKMRADLGIEGVEGGEDNGN